MASEREYFSVSGPLHLTTVDWRNAHYQRSVAASLVQGVYILERDRQEKRHGPRALAPPWWEFFHFHLLHQLVDNSDSSIFGAIYEYKPPSFINNQIDESPHYIIAFRGTMPKPDSILQDLKLDLHFIKNELHRTSRFEIAIQSVRNIANNNNNNNAIWLAGHSLGAAMAMLCGKSMVKTGIFLESFLFNPPFFSAPIERIKDKKLKHGIRVASSFITAGVALAVKGAHQELRSNDPFSTLSAWVPSLFVNPADHICSEYIGYFEHRKKMMDISAGGIERLAAQNFIGGLLMTVMGKESDPELPAHLIPSANLTVNLYRSPDFRAAHGIHQWWSSDLLLQSKLYKYK